MKITLKLADLEVEIDDPDEKNRTNLSSSALVCMENLLQYRLSLQGETYQGEEDDECNQPGQTPEQTDQQIRPAIQMANMFG